jgi:hypothetical protein
MEAPEVNVDNDLQGSPHAMVITRVEWASKCRNVHQSASRVPGSGTMSNSISNGQASAKVWQMMYFADMTLVWVATRCCMEVGDPSIMMAASKDQGMHLLGHWNDDVCEMTCCIDISSKLHAVFRSRVHLERA